MNPYQTADLTEEGARRRAELLTKIRNEEYRIYNAFQDKSNTLFFVPSLVGLIQTGTNPRDIPGIIERDPIQAWQILQQMNLINGSIDDFFRGQDVQQNNALLDNPLAKTWENTAGAIDNTGGAIQNISGIAKDLTGKAKDLTSFDINEVIPYVVGGGIFVGLILLLKN